MNEVVTTPEEKVKYAQTIINILQTRLNDSISQNIQLEAKLIRLQEDTAQADRPEPPDTDNQQ